MAVAQHAAAVFRVYHYGLCPTGIEERRTRQIIAHDSLQMAIAKAAPGLKWR